jgi:diguanylate cyclase (GGDEF)-like protein
MSAAPRDVATNADLLRQCSLLTEKVYALEIALAKEKQLAHYDALTGLPNQRLLLDRFNQAAALADRHSQQVALLFFDVNNFKRVNDDLGHNAGDELLRQVATRLAGSIRKSDTACRYGGDEFAILLPEIANHEHVVNALQKVRAKLASPYVIDRYSIQLTVSDGLAIYPRNAQRLTDLLRLADRSMYDNKPGNQCRSSSMFNSNICLNDADYAAKPAF